MSKLKKCKSCDHEVAKGAKICPNCGAKLKMGMMLKLIIVVALVAVAGAYFGMSPEEKKVQLTDTLKTMESAPASDYSPAGKLASHFNLGSENTDIQRDNLREEITGQIVQWKLKVYEVKLLDAENKKYKLQTPSGSDAVGTFVEVYARSDAEKSYIESLVTDDFVEIKGRIAGTFMRNIEIEDAIIIKP